MRQLGDGLLEWTSPTRRVYIDKPPQPNTVTFTDAFPGDAPSRVPAQRRAGPWATALGPLAPF
ncbi:hypothetical protein ACU045_16120 [Microbacterium sp. MAHUQ-60]|uniref:hypothetical protein n=1 Tax=unclassified Microbacterium TaxID=2609290 RepID=UPI0036161BBD